MREIKLIQIISCLALILLLWSCAGRDMEEAKVITTIRADSILGANENVMANKVTISDTSLWLQGYEKKAIAQVSDFINYMELLADKRIDKSMKQEVIKQAIQLFSDSTVLISGYFRDSSLHAISAFAKKASELPYDSVKVEVKKIIIKDSFKKNTDSLYIASIQVNHDAIAWQQQRPDTVFNGIKKIEVILKKKLKSFGTEQQQVWELKLGELK